MPQRLTTIDGTLLESPDVFMQRPKLAALIALIAAKWTRVENQVANMFASMLSAEHESALAVYLTFIDRNIREKAFHAVAELALPKSLQPKPAYCSNKCENVLKNEIAWYTARGQ